MSHGRRILEEGDDDPTALLLRTDSKLRRLSKRILRQQRLLQRELSEGGWLVYLRLEELVNERQFELIDRLLGK